MFNRPLSRSVYLALTCLLFVLYYLVLSYKKWHKFPWKGVLLIGLILCLSYPYLSADVFKYLFTGKIIAYYHSSPYLYPPNHFEGDLWLRFMRWVHTPTPYGPAMTALAVPYYLAGLGKFVPVLYLYKLSQLGWYALAIWCIGRLSSKNTQVRNQLYFALNPLVLIEWLVSAHNDAIMISLAILSLVLSKAGRGTLSFFSLVLSIGIKYVTVIFLPLILLPQKLVNKLIFPVYYLLLLLIPFLYHYSTQYQPWYVTWLVPLSPLIGSKRLMWFTVAYSLGALLRYLPYISTGLWVGTAWQFALLTFTPAILVLVLSYNKLYAHLSQAKTV